MSKVALVGSIVLAVSALPSIANAKCTAKIVQNTHAQENPRSILHPGQPWGPPTQLEIDPKTSAAFICAHGDYCYESDGIRLNGCTIVPLEPIGKEEPGDPILFGLQ